MGGFLDALGEKLADRWVALLVVPGALYCAAVAAAAVLGQAHAFDAGLLESKVEQWIRTPSAATTGAMVVLAAAILAAASTAGIAARGLGYVTELLVFAADWPDWPAPLRAVARRNTDRRRTRWAAADAVYQERRLEAARARAESLRVDPAARDAAYRRRTRIAELPPARPTWSGDRIHAVETRLRTELSVDLARDWPSVWLAAPEPVRTDVAAAHGAITRACVLGGWAVLYAVLAAWWIPALLIAFAVGIAAWSRIRSAVDAYARLVEAAVRLRAEPAAGAPD